MWPEVIWGLKSIGIEEMRILLSGTRLFMGLNVPDDFDLENYFQAYTDSSPKTAKWDELMRTYQKKCWRQQIMNGGLRRKEYLILIGKTTANFSGLG